MTDREIYERDVVRDGPDRRSSGPIIALIAVLVVGLILAIVLLGGDDDGSDGDGGGIDIEAPEDIDVDVDGGGDGEGG